MIRRSMVLLAAALIAGCGGDDDGDDDGNGAGTAGLRVVHAFAGAPAIDARLDDEAAFVSGLEFGNVAPAEPGASIEVGAGTRRLRIAAAGGGNPLLDAEVELARDGDYTLVAAGDQATGEVVPIELEGDLAVTAGAARFRFVHAASTLGPVDVYFVPAAANLPDVPLLSDVPFGTAVDLPEVGAGTYRFCVTIADAPNVACAVDVETDAPANQVASVVALDPELVGGDADALLVVERAGS